MKAAKLQDHLYNLEERLLHPEREADRADLAPLLSPEYKEFCTSGRIFSRQQTIDDIMNSAPRTATIHHFYVTPISETAALATYNATTAAAVSHRSSLWVFRDNRWQLLFHQGTIAS
jgi:hypothetical protein